ncbi:DLW-39 family protein [Rhodococcus sp. Q]|nr:DLW-39 family protein [Rhodococcus sp. Q]
MKILLVALTAVAVIFGIVKLRAQRDGEDVWHEVTSR